MAVGYIKLYRKITESFVWTNSDMFKLWCLCLMKASHEERKFLFNGQEVRLSSGQFVTGRDAIAKEFNQGVTSDQLIVSRTLWRWLKRFEKEEMLSISSTPKYSVITINNWTEYQASDQQVSSSRPASVQQVSTYKNDKNDKNDKNINNMLKKPKRRVYSNDDPNKKLAVLLLKQIRKNQNVKDPDIDKWANTIRLTIESDKHTGKEVQDMIIWATSHQFWSGVILSATGLRKHWDKMEAQKSKKSNKSIPDSELPETGYDW